MTQKEIDVEYSKICVQIGDLTSRIAAFSRKRQELQEKAIETLQLQPTEGNNEKKEAH
jgi:hypothetical protein